MNHTGITTTNKHAQIDAYLKSVGVELSHSKIQKLISMAQAPDEPAVEAENPLAAIQRYIQTSRGCAPDDEGELVFYNDLANVPNVTGLQRYTLTSRGCAPDEDGEVVFYSDLAAAVQ